MTVTIKNKLVRDFIPQYIERNGQKAVVEILDDKRFSEELLKKLTEEAQEVIEATTEGKSRLTEEIADLYEVTDSLIKLYGINKDDIKSVQKQKRSSNGGFNKKLYLVSVEDSS